MRTQPPVVEWQIIDNEAEWARLSAQQIAAAPSLVAPHRRFSKCTYGVIVVGLALLLMTSSGWHISLSGAQPDAPDMSRAQPSALQTVAAPNDESLVIRVRKDLRHEFMINGGSVLPGLPVNVPVRYLEPAITIVTLRADWALVSIVAPTKDGWLGCPEQRFYQRTATGWQSVLLDEDVLAILRQQKAVPANFGALCH